MPSWFESLIALVGDDTRQGALTVIGGAIAAVALGGWALFRHFRRGNDSTSHEIKGSQIRLSLDEYDRRLRLREAEVATALDLAHGSDKERLKSELTELQRRIGDVEASYEDSISKIRQLEETLAKISGEVPRNKLREAMDTLTQGEVDSAEAIFTDVLDEQREHLEIASAAAFGLGLIAEEKVDWAGAANHFSRSLGIYEYQSNLLRASTYLWRRGQYKEAVAVSMKLLKNTVDQYGENHEDTAGVLNNLAAQLYDFGEVDLAFEYLNRSIDIKRRIGQQEDANYAASLGNLANMYLIQGKYNLSSKYQKEALDIITRTVGPDDERYTTMSNALGESLRLLGDFTGAEVYMRIALDTDKRVFGDEHPFVARDLNFIGKLHLSAGRPAEAKMTLMSSFEIARKTEGIYHPHTAAIANNLLEALNNLPKDQESDRLASEIYETYAAGPQIEEAFEFAMGGGDQPKERE